MNLKNKNLMNELVSVIIPVFNGEKYIKECVQSLIDQTYGNIEIIIVNVCSTDGTLEELYFFKNRVQVINNVSNLGQAESINIGIRESKGEYIALCDADDYSRKSRILKQVNKLNSLNVGMVYSSRFIVHKRSTHEDLAVDTSWCKLLTYNSITRSSVLIRKKVLDLVGTFDKEISGSDDWDMWVRISEKYTIGRVKEPLVYYRVHDDNVSMNRSNPIAHQYLSREYILRKTIVRHVNIFCRLLVRVLYLRAFIEARLPIFITAIFIKNNLTWHRVNKMLNYIETSIICPISSILKCKK